MADGTDLELLDRDLWLVRDTCNVYLVKRGNRGIAVDFGTGKCLAYLQDLGIETLEHVFLTHHHADQCMGLSARSDWPFTIHAAQGEKYFLDPQEVSARHEELGRTVFFPQSYELLEEGIPNVSYDMAAFCSRFWGSERIRFMSTPGHGPNACSVIINRGDKQVAFCGDAIHDGATLWRCYNLEWDHWTGTGVLRAWQGVKQLSDISIDMLCPSHGPVIQKEPAKALVLLAQRLMRFYDCKNAISPGERDNYVEPQRIWPGYEEILPGFFHCDNNGYLIVSASGKGLFVDPCTPHMEILERMLRERLPGITIDVAVSSHCHGDHTAGMAYLKEKHGTRVVVHPTIVEARELAGVCAPQNLPEPDEVWPGSGSWRWEEYDFQVDHFPGQTWWHTGFMTAIGGRKVFFSGDSFQPNTRWNGTGGFCAYFNSRFREGFVASAKRIIAWRPDIMAAGHGGYYWFSEGKLRKTVRWAEETEDAIRALCPNGDMDRHYYGVSRTEGLFSGQ